MPGPPPSWAARGRRSRSAGYARGGGRGRLAEEELGLARRFAGPSAAGVALSVLGLAVGGAEGIECLREATAVLEASPARLELARALVNLGAALRRSGQRVQAREHLHRGL